MSNVNGGAHKPELDNMTPAMIRVLCEELLYTMDCDQRWKIAKKIPGIYKMVYGSLPETFIEQTAAQVSNIVGNCNNLNAEEKMEINNACIEALKKIGL